tara:strand:+ start:1133 stop:1405 length:273 start_codon:yes stop_codon:yes gene_type:complete
MSDSDVTQQAIFDLIAQTRKELSILRDNHLAHISADLSSVKVELAMISSRLEQVEEFHTEIESWIRDYTKKALTVVLSVAFGSLGIVNMM